MLDFGREVCGHLPVAERREWLVTNGIGGFAMGTVSGLLTRRYHGYLLAALQPPLGRTLLLAKFDETAGYDGREYPLFSNRWADGSINPHGYIHIERFHLEGTTPVWTFALGDALLEKRIWMAPGANTTYVQYRLLSGSRPLRLRGKAFVNYRDYHATSQAGEVALVIEPLEQGLRLAPDGGRPFYLLAREADWQANGRWNRDFFLAVEDYRGQDDCVEDHLLAGTWQAKLQPGESLTLVASTEEAPQLDGQEAYAARRAYEQALLERSPFPGGPADMQQLILAADQFIVRRAAPGDPGGRSIIAGYPWFSDWGRDTMIALPGLTLATGRPDAAARILRTFAHFVDRGMLPNRFPDEGEEPEYNTVDATLWYFQAVQGYHAATGDDTLLAELFPVLQEIIDWHQRGTRYQIKLDAADGLLYAGEPGVQLTWMDAKIDDWVVTPRIGKPVEINALWYNALRLTADFARCLGEDPEPYLELAERARQGFERFWNEESGSCFDVIDGPEGNDGALRPNQLLAASLPYSPLSAQRQKAVVDACARRLLTSHGLRSLSPEHPDYIGRHEGDRRTRDGAYHQGTVWGWLIGPFASAHYRVYGDAGAARRFLQPLFHHLADGCVGSISEIFDGDPPFTPRGCPAQAWSVAEMLRVWQEIIANGEW